MSTEIGLVKPEEYEKVLSILAENQLLPGEPDDWRAPFVFRWKSSDAFQEEVETWREDTGSAVRVLDGRLFSFVVCDDEIAAMAFKVRFG